MANFLLMPYLFPLLADNHLQYLNIFNWCGFFWLGTFLQKKTCILLLYQRLYPFRFVIIAIFSAVLLFMQIENIRLYYWSMMYPLYALSFVAFAFACVAFIGKFKIISLTGRISFSIYLLHMPIAGFLVHITSRLESFYGAVAVILCPFICIFILDFLIWCYMKFIPLRMLNITYSLIGLPKRMIKNV